MTNQVVTFSDPLNRLTTQRRAASPTAPPAVDRLTDAASDREAVQSWLMTHRDSKQTLAAYRKEAERFVLWLRAYAGGRQLAELTVEDIESYKAFMAKPPREWVGDSRPRTDPEWRPFRGPLSESSIRYALIVLREMMSFLVNVRYLRASPFTATKLKKQPESSGADQVRQLGTAAWRVLAETIQSLPSRTETQAAEKARSRFIMIWGEAIGGRASEMAQSVMSDVRRAESGGGEECWWWRVRGKGNRVEEVPVSDDALGALMQYRQHLGLDPLPSLAETDVPLIWRVKGAKRDEHVSRSTIWRITKRIFSQASARAAEYDPDVAAILETASTHWLRHSTASNLLRTGDHVNQVKEIMRHVNISTTMLYMHNEKDELHQRANRRSALSD